MAVSYKVDIADLGLSARFDQLAAQAEDMTDLMDNIGSVLINGARERISSSNVGPDGTPWPKSLRAELDGGKTLLLSAGLRDSITSEAARNEVTVGSNKIYAGVHQTGAVIRPINAEALSFTLADGSRVVAGAVEIPARPYLGISEAERDRIEDVAGIFLVTPLTEVQ